MKRDRFIREKDAGKVMEGIGVDPRGIKIMEDKAKFRLILLSDIPSPMANIIKECMLSAGGDAAVHKLSCCCKVPRTDVLLMGTLHQYRKAIRNLAQQPFGGKNTAKRIRTLLETT